jgi:hypothetical protein
MEKILVKKHVGPTSNESYLVYLVSNDDTLLSCEIVYTEKSKDRLVSELSIKHNISEINNEIVHNKTTEMEMLTDKFPLILVFYMDRELMASNVMGKIATSINDAIALREANAMAFFVPTDGEEKIECINPIAIGNDEMSKVNKIVQDLVKNFDIGQGADEGKDDPSNEIEVDG